MTAPRSRPLFGPLLIALAAVLAAPLAHAQWEVTDQDTHDKLKELNDRFKVKMQPPINQSPALFQRESTAPSGDPLYGPPNPTPQGWSSDGLDGIEKICSGVSGNQADLCTQIANTRKAYYDYMYKMYLTNSKRYEMLRKLTDDRKNIPENEFGHLQGNTNEILALQTLITLDRQQMESVDHGYRMRIDFLTQQMTQLAKDAASGKTNSDPVASLISNITSTVVGGLVLQGALALQSSQTPDGFRKLEIDQ
jgi:hypothetical protein